MKHTQRRTIGVLFFALTFVGAPFALAVDATYYSSLEGKSGSDLRTALTSLTTSKHTTTLGYNWVFDGIDIVDGTLEDIYSTCDWTTTGSDQCGTYSSVCDCYNREHVVPQSLFNEVSPQVGDRHHLFLTDGKVNNQRSNYPFGECSSGNSLDSKALGKLGTSTFSGYTSVGTVFEPDDKYKGDIARAIMYMAIRYATVSNYPVTSWSSNAMFSGSLSTNYGLSDYAVTLLMKWHRNDPVSQKEITRNSGVENNQGNRNPFIDYPYLAEYLWGEKADETVSLTNLVGSFESDFVAGQSNGCKAASTDSGDSETETETDTDSDSGRSASAEPLLMIGTPIVVENEKKNDIVCTGTATLQVHISNLATSVSVTSSDTSVFTVTPATISPSEAAAGTEVTITKVSNGSATLTIRGSVVNQAIGVTCQ